MDQQNFSFNKKLHFFTLIEGIPKEKILFCPIDVSKDFHVGLLHDINSKPLSDFFQFSSSKVGFHLFTSKLESAISTLSPQLVLIGMEPTSVYFEGLLHNLHLKYSPSTCPRFQLCIVDPAAVSLNRCQHSIHFHKTDYIDTAAIGDLLTRGLYTPAHFPSASCLRIRELSRSVLYYRKQMLSLFNRLLVSLDRVFPNLLIDYADESPLCRQPIGSHLLDDLLHCCPDPYLILDLSLPQIIDLFHTHHRRMGPKGAEKIKQVALRALLQPQTYQQVHLQTLAHQLESLDFFRLQIESLTAQMCELIKQTPARHLLAISGNSEKLTAELMAALEDWQRWDSVSQIWRAAGLAPVYKQSGQHSTRPQISKGGSVWLRLAIYKMTSSVIWHEPRFGIPCFKRLIEGKAFVPSVLHIGRKLLNTVLALLKTDKPFKPGFEDYQKAKEILAQMQKQYGEQKKRKT